MATAATLHVIEDASSGSPLRQAQGKPEGTFFFKHKLLRRHARFSRLAIVILRQAQDEVGSGAPGSAPRKAIYMALSGRPAGVCPEVGRSQRLLYVLP
jgi:hypothetical protein